MPKQGEHRTTSVGSTFVCGHTLTLMRPPESVLPSTLHVDVIYGSPLPWLLVFL